MERVILRQALSQAVDASTFAPLADALGFVSVKNPINYLSDSSGEISKRLKPLAKSLLRVGAFESERAHAGLWVATLPDWGDRDADRERTRRRIAKALVELAPAGDRNVLLILAAEGVDDIELVLPRQRSKGALGTVRALVSKSDPTRHHLELLESLILKPGDETAAITRRWTDAFNVEKVTKSFYLEFRALRDRIVEVIKNENSKNPLLAVADEDDVAQAKVQRYVTRNLGRVLFLWFIQSKGWLNSDSHYLLNLYNTRCRVGRGHNFYRETLIPLFFDALAKKPKARPEVARSLGDLPYLNGGLFIQTAFEDQLYGDEREHLDVVIPNELFDPRVHDPKAPTVLGLLSSYRFTTRESTPDNLSVDPDPELLGKVFENLNEDRKKTGTYYTPREIVRFMCREALDGYLHHVTGVTSDTLDALRLEALDPAATDIRLSAEERMRLEKALLEVKVCDPAVGSGAFPVGMLQEIIQLLIGIEQSADVSVSVGGQRVAEWKEKIITNCLYGVDINLEAVEICHLRLWLSMVIDADKPVPLPNLDFRFEAGDSLVDRIAELRLLDSLPEEKERMLALDAVSTALQNLERLRAKYALTTDPAEARRLRAVIKKAQIDVVKAQIEGRIAGCRDTLKHLHKKLTEMRRLSTQPAHSRNAQKEADDLATKIQILERFRDHLAPDAPYKKPFLWPVEFPEVFEKGGFDIVVANPPYVRQEKLAPEDQQAYAASFPEVSTGTADLLVYFFARAIQIIKENGRLAFITSNKFHRAGYGEKLREYLPKVMAIEHVVDFGDLAVFDALAYPSIFVAAKRKPGAEMKTKVAKLAHVVRRELAEARATENVATVRERLEDLEGLLERNGIADFPQALLRHEGWVLEDPKLVRLFDRLMGMGTPLGEFVQGRMYRGVLTGLNEAFVIDEAKRAELIAADPKSTELIKPWLRGKDIKRWCPEWAGLYVIFARRGTRINSYPAIKAHLKRWQKELKPKSTASQKGPGRKPGAYEWFEIQDNIAYYAEFEQPKVVWATITPEPRFLWDADSFYTNQKCYIATGLPKWAVGIMNSSLMFALAAGTKLSERQGGFYEWEKKYMSALPIITPDELTQKALSAATDSSRHEPGVHDAEVDYLVATMYGITPDEQRLLNEWVEVRRRDASIEEPDDE